jgi:hypothetical protein
MEEFHILDRRNRKAAAVDNGSGTRPGILAARRASAVVGQYAPVLISAARGADTGMCALRSSPEQGATARETFNLVTACGNLPDHSAMRSTR